MRTTITRLIKLIDQINKELGTPKEPWRDGKACIGNYYLDGAYGGVALYQIMSISGGVHDVFGRGHMPRRDLELLLCGMLEGINEGETVENLKE